MFRKLVDNVAGAMVAKKEGELRDVLNAAFPTGWTMDDVRGRCRLIRYTGSLIEMLFIDGIPALEIHPLEFTQEQTDTGWTMRVTQKYRRLNRSE